MSAFDGKRRADAAPTAYRDSVGRIWRYRGKRARVLDMLATMPQGLTQWDTLPWHTRLGGTIHALREDGLVITTELEGECRHARYRLGIELIAEDASGQSNGPRLKNNQRKSNGGRDG